MGGFLEANTPIIAFVTLAFIVLLVRLSGKKEGVPNCPKCKSVMVTRVASKGKHYGKAFWGCSQHRETGCKGVRMK
jgi:ssDNA-binding Zn-finger/Zn-ribbon topoisomerase 1